jgi:hypothetical protein
MCVAQTVEVKKRAVGAPSPRLALMKRSSNTTRDVVFIRKDEIARFEFAEADTPHKQRRMR